MSQYHRTLSPEQIADLLKARHTSERNGTTAGRTATAEADPDTPDSIRRDIATRHRTI